MFVLYSTRTRDEKNAVAHFVNGKVTNSLFDDGMSLVGARKKSEAYEHLCVCREMFGGYRFFDDEYWPSVIV